MLLTYTLPEIVPYINWIYFFHAWGFKARESDQEKAAEACRLKQDAEDMLHELDKVLKAHCLFRIAEAVSEDDDLWIDNMRFPLLRQQTSASGPCLCLSDFIRPKSHHIADHIGLFASTVNLPDADRWKETDPYRHLLLHTLCDRLAEAATEKMHEYVRKQAWGYAPDEHLSIPELLSERFQGIRPAVGYPSLPDQSVNFLLDKLLDMTQIGITLTEHGAMHPHASVSGLMIAHPAAHYFSVGKIGKDQWEDYARRRGLPPNTMRKFLPL